LLFFLVGCATPHRKAEVARAPDWESPDLPKTVESAPPPQPPAAPPSPHRVFEPGPAETWVSLERWTQVNGFADLRRVSVFPLKCLLTTDKGLLTVEAGSRSARWNGVEFQLGFAPWAVGGDLFVHALDVRKNFLPLLGTMRDDCGTNRVIVIDPGHGGMNVGAKNVFNGAYEKDFTLDWAKRLKPLLEAQGWTVFLTRTNDMEVPLADRMAFADQHGANLFVSLHFNSASPREEEAGLETYCLTPTGMPSNLTRGFDDATAQVFPNNAFDTQNFQYAFRLHRALLEVSGNRDRGVRRARFIGVLRGQNRPAVLLEGGYLSNPAEARQIADPQYRQKLAEAVAAALK
jgi:N-acetylmuramoyl-L-alanine amidase